MLSRQIIFDHRPDIAAIARRHGAFEVCLIGSLARDSGNATSDVDFVARFEPGRSLLDHGGFVMDLQDLLHASVDVIDADALQPRFKAHILPEAIPL